MSPRIIALALSLLFSGPLLAADESAKAPAKRPPAVERPAPVVPPVVDQDADLVGRAVYLVLLGELALQRGQADLALGAYSELLKRTQDAQVLARATEVAVYARQLEQALFLARQWVKVEPESQKAQQTLSSILVMLNRLEDLAPQIAALLAQDKAALPDNLLKLNRMLARQTDKASVFRLVEKVVQPYLDLAEAHLALATAASNAGDASRAAAEVRRALEIRPDQEVAALMYAQVLIRESATAAADFLIRFVQDNPGARDARLSLARLLVSERRYDEARGHFDRLLKDYPDNPDVIYPVAMLSLQQNDLVNGRIYLEKLLAIDFPDKSTLHYFLGQIDEEEKAPAAALVHYQQVVGGEQVIPARARAAQILVGQGKFNEARQLIQTTPTRNPQEKTQLILAESQMLREAKQIPEALALLEKTLVGHPDSVDVLYDAALLAERLGKFDVLERYLKRLLELKPDHAQGLNALGYSWADRNIHLDEAHDLIQRALVVTPDDPFILDSLGWVLFRQGKLEDARRILAQAYQRRPDPEIAAHLGEVLWSLGYQQEARQIWREALTQHPDSEPLQATFKKFQP